MSLSIETLAAAGSDAGKANPKLLRLAPAKWLTKITEYAQLRTQKRDTAAAAKAAEDAYKAARGELLMELGVARAATCGRFVLAVKETAAAEASITLVSGRKIKLSAVTSILVGNETIPASDLLSVYGGRSGGIDLDVTG